MKHFIDEITVTFNAGSGGAGLISFGKMAKSGPDGGNGGSGGDIYLEARADITLLSQFASVDLIEGKNGGDGKRNKQTGKDGEDTVIYVPLGITLTEIETIHPNGLTTSGETHELLHAGDRVCIAHGGKGGKGNWEFRSPTRTTPRYAQSGLPGEKRIFHINLKLIADIGFIGLPNAGKTSLLNVLTNAKAKVGSYAFTTLTPNLGVFEGIVLADIPGLIEGAHTGRGLGDTFLKHIERVNLLFHCISAQTDNILSDYLTIRKELESFSKELSHKKEIVLLTKVDLVSDEDAKNKIKILKKQNKEIFTISLFDEDLVEKLKEVIRENSQKV